MVYVVIILLIFILDDKIKEYIEKNKRLNESEEKCGGKIIIEKYYNKGAMLNFMDKTPKFIKYFSGGLLVVLSILLIFLMPKKGKTLLKVSLSLIIGGAASNVYDRIKKGYVVDYIGFKCIKNVIFNISDFFIFIGSILVVIESFISDLKEK